MTEEAQVEEVVEGAAETSAEAPAENTSEPAQTQDEPAPEPEQQSAEPVDWRKQIAGDDEKALTRLERFSSAQDFFKSYQEAENRIREGFKAPELPENATEEQLAEYRKAAGVPESPDAYEMKAPEGVVIGENDVPLWDMFKEQAHANNVSQAEFEKIIPAYYAMEAKLRESQEAQANEAYKANEQALKQAWGSDYESNLSVNENFLIREGGESLKEKLSYGYTADGSPIVNDPEVAQFLNKMARLNGFNDSMNYSSEETLGSIEDQIKEITDKRTGWQARQKDGYWNTTSRAQQDKDTQRLNELLRAKERFSKNG